MPPIRVGLVGLSGAPPDQYEGTSWTPSAHLPYLLASPHYEIVALLNTSVASGKAAIERYSLPLETKAYGKPEDPTVDLVVVSIRVDRHFAPVRPSIIAGKSVFVEWPLERNLEVAKEMAALAAKHGSKTMVGLQGSFSPVIRKLKETVAEEKIGKILSSTVFASMVNAGPKERKNVRYFLDREVGGSILSIHLGHAIEYITSVLGEITTWNSLLSNRHEFKDIIDPSKDNKIIVKDAPNTVPDQIMLHGLVSPSNAPISIHFRGGKQFPGTPALEWRIQGEKGELRLTSSSFGLNVGTPDTKVELFDEESGIVEELVPNSSELDDLPIPAQNIARLYEAFRKGEWYPDFEWAVKRHEMLAEIWRRHDEATIYT
ncbi:Galactose/lactose metabolism regulatory protein [Lachnellula suecica]|uniref:Galactose/lactose metabolism regulatory protein n=1 Tax=Lachnellula suecica TaxID=602035 RepID=A0A8T9C7H2_9HELO|nr:Galactose/lactose metabolism regulatory protein [Lachnellula suecica]